jgi:predicted nucleic acid-binding protein
VELANDQNHAAATEHWEGVVASHPRLVTTSWVLGEVLTFLNRRGHHAKAVQVGNVLLRSPSIELVNVDEPLLFKAWGYFQQHADKRFSLADCISFVLMKERGVETALAFDRHFVQAGFLTEP